MGTSDHKGEAAAPHHARRWFLTRERRGTVAHMPARVPLAAVTALVHAVVVVASTPAANGADGAIGSGVDQAVASAAAWASQREGFVGYEMLAADGTSLAAYGSATRLRSASVIKAVIAAAALERATKATWSAVDGDVGRAIRVSDNDAAQRLYVRVGRDDGLLEWWRGHGLPGDGLRRDPDRKSTPWGYLNVSAHGLAVFGARLRAGSLIDDAGTRVLLEHMRSVTPAQRFGAASVASSIVADPQPAVKNGWYPDPQQWRVTCLAMVDRDSRPWRSIAILTSYPKHLGVRYGQRSCTDLSKMLLRIGDPVRVVVAVE